MIVDFVEWLENGGLLVHESCNRRTVSMRETFSRPWGLPSFWCSYCKADISHLEVPEFKWGQKLPTLVDPEVARLEEMM